MHGWYKTMKKAVPLTQTIIRNGDIISREVLTQMVQDLKAKGTVFNPATGTECPIIEVHVNGRALIITVEVEVPKDIHNPPPGPISMGCRIDPTLCVDGGGDLPPKPQKFPTTKFPETES